LPGTLRPIIEKYELQDQFIYNPYLIAMGTVAEDFLNPDLLMIGNYKGEENKNVKKLIDFYSTIVKIEKHTNRPYIMVGTYEDAECCKIFHNTYISAKVGIANMIQDVTHKIGNANPDTICQALQHADRVVGKRYMMPGMGDGGPCHPRDNIALSWLAKKLDLGYDLFKDIMQSREVQTNNLQKFITEYSSNLPIVILGSSFKPETHLTDGSSALLLGHYLLENGHKVIYDRVVNTASYCYVLCHNIDYSNYEFNQDSVVIDVFRNYKTDRKDLQVFYYGIS
jgi:UDPglucose 6-dehydrogenase